MSYLERDFNEKANKVEESGYRGEMLRSEVKHLQSILPAFGYPLLGDLFSTNLSDIEASIRW